MKTLNMTEQDLIEKIREKGITNFNNVKLWEMFKKRKSSVFDEVVEDILGFERGTLSNWKRS
jgi:hypothetical protein